MRRSAKRILRQWPDRKETIRMRFAGTVRAIALVEGAKRALVLAGGFGALSLIHRDVQRVAEQMIAHLHLNPASRYPRIFIDAAGGRD